MIMSPNLSFSKKPTTLSELVNAVKDYVTNNKCTRTKRAATFGPRWMLQRLDVETRALETKVEVPTQQLLEVTMLVKKFQLFSNDVHQSAFSNDVITCLHCKKKGNYAASCHANSDRDTTCVRCDKKGHLVSRYWKNTREPSKTLSDNAVMSCNEHPNSNEIEDIVSTVLVATPLRANKKRLLPSLSIQHVDSLFQNRLV